MGSVLRTLRTATIELYLPPSCFLLSPTQLTDSGGLNSTSTCLVTLEDYNDRTPYYVVPEDFSEAIYVERVRSRCARIGEGGGRR